MSKEIKFPAPVLVEFRGEALATCDRHARRLADMNYMMGKFTPIEPNPKDEECASCVKEEKERKERHKEYQQPSRRRSVRNESNEDYND